MKIEKDCIVIELKNGNKLLIDNEDYETIIKKIKFDLIAAVASKFPDRIYFEKDINEGKIIQLYTILRDQKDMSKELRDKYLSVILELSQSNAKTLVQLKEKTN